MARPRIPLADRFWANVQKTDGCWSWTGEKNRLGYGRFFIEVQVDAQGRRFNIRNMAHRFAWQLTYGTITDELRVLHHCDNPSCVRPDHLFLGTHQDNSNDMIAKERQLKGAQHGRAKLTEADVLTIRARYAAGGISHRALARQYGVGGTTIMHILHRENWRHLI
jgi:HNH endonuclease